MENEAANDLKEGIMPSCKRAFALTAPALLLMCAACSGVTNPTGGSGTLIFSATVSSTAVATLVVQVTAADITNPLVFNFPVANGVVSGTMTLPAGSKRTISMHAYDAGAVLTDTGSVTINVQSGTNPTITLVLAPLSGSVAINVTLGSIKVTVTPLTSTISLGSAVLTVQLTAGIVDQNGSPVTGSVSWATAAPGIASVNASGLVTALGVGQTNIFATFQGAVGSAAITVTP